LASRTSPRPFTGLSILENTAARLQLRPPPGRFMGMSSNLAMEPSRQGVPRNFDWDPMLLGLNQIVVPEAGLGYFLNNYLLVK
jgi:hypothetical protein